ncbi:hypothetical protein ACWEV3_35115 [Saccharopolyspora sp. NPDC003752]
MLGPELRIWCWAAAAGPTVYVLSQAIYFRVETGTGWLAQPIGVAALGVAAAAACWLPSYAVIALLIAIVLGPARHLSRGTADSATP